MTKIYIYIDDTNTVTERAVFDDDNLPEDLGWSGWVQRNASPGDTYVPEADLFHSPSPYEGWVLDENYEWQPPADKPYPDGFGVSPNTWHWDEETSAWVEAEIDE